MCFLRVCWPPRRAGRALSASARSELIVDADAHSISEIQEAISWLQQHSGMHVGISVFAAPGRSENRKWEEFMRTPDVTFQPVPRRHAGEPNDQAILAAIDTFAAASQVKCVALVTSDTDFIVAEAKLRQSGSSFLAFIPQNMPAVIGQYEDAGIRVVILRASERQPNNVRAILQKDGTGSVKIADPYFSIENKHRAQVVMDFLEQLGYRQEVGYTIQACAKFWFTHRLGSLTVFPSQLATLALHDMITQGPARD
ncbi:unnamed protein product [Effrenium voratum]|nr:unnamed protein product [Effrenium voratum]